VNKIPKQIAIEVTNKCQLKCVGCFQNLGLKKHEDMNIDYVKSIIDRNTFGATIIPFLWGEPILYSHIYEMFEYIVKKKQRAYLTSNALIWNDDLFELITQKNSVYQMIFSIDGLPGSRSIEVCRPGSDATTILQNIMRFKALKEKNRNNIDLCLKICQRGQDWEEIENFIYYWLKLGIDYICVGRMLNQSGMLLRKYPCQYFNDKFLLIRVDKEIIPCMYCEEVAINNCFEIGKLNDTEDLVKAYNRPVLQELRIEQEHGVFKGPCKNCNSAYTGHGMRGQYVFNDPEKKDIGVIYSTQDYYNQTFSLEDKAKGIQYGND